MPQSAFPRYATRQEFDPDPSAWFRKKHGSEPDYCKLLDVIAKTPTERQQLLRGYFEPTDDERDEGLKLPSAAHKAIAKLVAAGYLRVIITTNFDRLMEKALEEAGVAPTVISTTDQLTGALPLAHSGATVIKLHGDYLDTRIKNTEAELAAYDEPLNKLIDRVFDEYGLIVCGWSGKWDVALGEAIERCPSRRFSTFWATITELSERAARLAQNRKAEIIKIQGADPFFSSLLEKVTALEDISAPHPLSAKIAVATVKKYLVDPAARIRLRDLVHDETERVYEQLRELDFSAGSGRPPAESVGDQARKYEALTETLVAILITGCYWGDQEHVKLWVGVMERIGNPPANAKCSYFPLFPAVLLFNAAGLAAIASDNYKTLTMLFTEPLHHKTFASRPLLLSLTIDPMVAQYLPGTGQQFVRSDYLYEKLRSSLMDYLPEEKRFDDAFNRFEYLLALVYCDLELKEAGRVWGPPGRSSMDPETQEAFLRLVLEEDRSYLFEALDFAPSIFREIPMPSDFMLGWLNNVRKAVGDDLYQRGFWGCVENYSTFQPVAALQVVDQWLKIRPEGPARNTIARMLHWIRNTGAAHGDSLKAELEGVEAFLRSPGGSELRGLYLESWAFEGESPALDEAKAFALRDELLSGEEDELVSWCFLLARVVQLAPDKWLWSYRELMRLSNLSLSVHARYWLIVSAVYGWRAAKPEHCISRQDWEILLFKLQPLSKDEGGAWNQLQDLMVNTLSFDVEAARDIIVRIASASGRAWSVLLDNERDAFGYLHRTLETAGRAVNIISALCLAKSRSARRVGVKMFARCFVAGLDPAQVAITDAVQLELLIHEVSLQTHEYSQVARLHASIAGRVDELGGGLAEMFYDEVSVQALNTNGYRKELEAAANGHEKLLMQIKAAHERLDASIAAAQSPALRMRVPGRERADALASRRFAKQVAQSVGKHSILPLVGRTVQLLYGREWRMQDSEGNLTEASGLKTMETSMEIPRLEYVTPDALRIRRLFAVRRIDELQTTPEEDNE